MLVFAHHALHPQVLRGEIGLGIQNLYDGDRSRQLDGLGLVLPRMTEPDTIVEEDLGGPSRMRILLEEIYFTFMTPVKPETRTSPEKYTTEHGSSH
jgi:hypothetical protein